MFIVQIPVHYIVVIALVMVNVMSLHMMVDGMDKVVVKEFQCFLHKLNYI